MDPKDDSDRATRRRGPALEAAILDAGWATLIGAGFGGFTFDAVAELAGTSKPVLYRRWSNREELLRATLRRRGQVEVVPAPDTGSLRGDVIAMLQGANQNRGGMAAMFSALLGAYFDEITMTPAELRLELLADRPPNMDTILERAEARGEIRTGLPARVRSLPFDLYRHEAFMTLQPVPDDVIRTIVDDVFLPLVTP